MFTKGSVYKRVPLFAQICLAIAALLFAGCAAVKMSQPATEDTAPASIEAIKVTSFGGETTVVEVVNSTSVPYQADPRHSSSAREGPPAGYGS